MALLASVAPPDLALRLFRKLLTIRLDPRIPMTLEAALVLEDNPVEYPLL